MVCRLVVQTSRLIFLQNKNIGSCLGAALAARDIGLPRVMLFVGDGSLCVAMTGSDSFG